MSEPMRKILYYENILEFKACCQSTLQWSDVKNWELCRTCLADAVENFVDFNVIGMDGNLLNVEDMLAVATGILIVPGDRLPTKMCKECLNKITTMYSFKLQTKRAEDILKRLLCKLDEAEEGGENIQVEEMVNHDVDNTITETTCDTIDEHIELFLAEEEKGDYTETASCKIKEETNQTEGDDPVFSAQHFSEEEKFDYEKKDFLEIDELMYNEWECDNNSQDNVSVTSIEIEEEISVDFENEFIEEDLHQIENSTEAQKNVNEVLLLLNIENMEVSIVRDNEQEGKNRDMLEAESDNSEKTKFKKRAKMVKPFLGSLVCKTCQEEFKTQRLLTAHVQEAHPKAKPFKCQKCDATFAHTQSLSRHMQIHCKLPHRNICNFCDKGFLRGDDLKRHMRVHTGERPYVCYCQKSFKQSNELKEHQISHMKAKLFKCNICGHSLSSRNGLYIHKKIHEGIKKYKCTNCDKAFLTKGELKSHMKVHTKK